MAGRTNRDLKKKIRHLIQNGKKGMSSDRIASLLRIKKRERTTFLFTLAGMEREGEIVRDRKGKYVVRKQKGNIITAKLVALQKGYGFARPENGDEDVFVPGRYLNDALPGDMVKVRIEADYDGRTHGMVLQVLEEGKRLFTGKIMVNSHNIMIVDPDAFIRYPIPVKQSKELSAKPGDKVRFEVFYNRLGELVADVKTIYGSADSAKICADAIVDAAGIPTIFPEPVRTLAQTLSERGVLQEELEGRDDLRSMTIFTIDGADAKDLDDAISLEETETGWSLGVHIADVSHYVKENSSLDIEARIRGTSVYFADRVIPMLPTELSNGICSLNPGEDKLALSAIISLDKNCAFTGLSLRKTVIRSCLRGVYSEVNRLFDGTADSEIKEKYEKVMSILFSMRKLAKKLREKAAQRGTMDLISSESVFTLDDEGHPIDIHKRIMGESEGMIEQFMIAANVAVADFARKQGIPFIYRVHDQPDEEKLAILSEVAVRLGFKTHEIKQPADLRKLMEEARETPYARLISDRILRSMAKARYSDAQTGHYGLFLSDYCHFTAPIRRYPDLSIHRILTSLLSKTNKDEIIKRYTSFAKEAAELSSQYEIRAMNAERDCESCYMAEYMGGFIGAEFEGIISSVSVFGLFVELPNSVEGMVRLESLPEAGLKYDEIASFVDRKGRPVYTVGDTMKIRVAGTDVSSGQIDFEPIF
jgi:ribonuclease R